MGKSRDQLIKNYGGTPFSETGKTVRQAGLEALAAYLAKGELPPEFLGPAAPRETSLPDTAKKDDA